MSPRDPIDTPSVTEADVRRVALLAHLELDDEAVQRAVSDLRQLLTLVAKLDALDLTDVEPTIHPVPLSAPTRHDKVVPTLSRAELLANAPHSAGGLLLAPRAVDGGN